MDVMPGRTQHMGPDDHPGVDRRPDPCIVQPGAHADRPASSARILGLHGQGLAHVARNGAGRSRQMLGGQPLLEHSPDIHPRCAAGRPGISRACRESVRGHAPHPPGPSWPS
ncbi:hypothetical protein SDC9_165170 [bioreactor metagenome]|uniref:Uncharacterized protein n=1 Tax=bioreactor metagenome TaxID=1076179 RepID=A0A645FTM4_9ZZZZ